MESSDELVKRISISLPPDVFLALDELVAGRGFRSRSQAIAEMIEQSRIEYHEEMGHELMAGTITLFYDESRPGLLKALADIERRHVDEVISSQHVLLESNHTMEVLLVQGPAERLRDVANELVTCRGVKAGRLTISSAILPPIHPLPEKGGERG
ncbi:MAG: ribbon-helix-helix protein, CopG family [Verrucomicrobiota bacterium]